MRKFVFILAFIAFGLLLLGCPQKKEEAPAAPNVTAPTPTPTPPVSDTQVAQEVGASDESLENPADKAPEPIPVLELPSPI